MKFHLILQFAGSLEMKNSPQSYSTFLIESSKPLKDYETTFAADSSGFGTSLYYHYFSHKYGKGKRIHTKDFLKANIMIGVSTHIITAAIISRNRTHDVKYMPELVDTTAKNFKIGDVCADPAYLADYNMVAVAKHGGTPYILFKSSSCLHPTDEAYKSRTWMKMVRLFHNNPEFFMEKYHKRSNVETVFSMLKKKLNTNLKSKDEVAQKNELLCNLICHNLIVLIHEVFESGLEIDWVQSLCQNKKDNIIIKGL